MLFNKMLCVMADVKAQVAERDELIEAIAIALLTSKNLFILGDTGQAKSFVINEFRRRIVGAKQFERLLSKQADEEQLFGRIDLSSLIPGNVDKDVLESDSSYQAWLVNLKLLVEGGADTETIEKDLKELDILKRAYYAIHGNKPRLVTDGKIPDSHIVFLDECFKANDGVLNSLLTALNERRYTNEGTTMDIPVISFFAASNEIPNFNNAEEQILKPLYDRLELKLVTEYVQDKDARMNVLVGKQSGTSGIIRNTITLDELYAMQADVAAVAVSDNINELMDDILCELREKGIHVSDRKYFAYYPLAQAMAWLKGGDTVEAHDLLILRHYLWTSPDERTVINQLLERKCINPLKEKLDDILRMAVESFADFEGTGTTVDTAKRIGKFRNEYISLYESIVTSLARAQSEAEKTQISASIAQLEDYSKKAHAIVNYTYAPLNEQYELRKTA
jgi:MoxR-like ATPase